MNTESDNVQPELAQKRLTLSYHNKRKEKKKRENTIWMLLHFANVQISRVTTIYDS